MEQTTTKIPEDLVWRSAKRPPEYCQMEVAEKDGLTYVRKDRKEIVYVGKKNKEFTCSTCGTTILTAIVTHPVHDGPFPLSGSGRCRNEEVPYCPKCEEKPSSSGEIITQGQFLGVCSQNHTRLKRAGFLFVLLPPPLLNFLMIP